MNSNTVKIFDVPITTAKRVDILENISKYLLKQGQKGIKKDSSQKHPITIFTPNPEILRHVLHDKKLLQIVRTGTINIPDGSGVVWAIRRLFGVKLSRITGVDMVYDLAKLSAKNGYSILLIGGRPRVAVDALECLGTKYPSLKGDVVEAIFLEVSHGNLHFTTKEGEPLETIGQVEYILNKIDEKGADIVFVGLGCPKQEYLIDELKVQSEKLKVKRPVVLMAVGGSFDTISGKIPRAPLFMRNLGIEWLYRLVREPRRIVRMLSGGEFFLRVLQKKQ